MYLFQICDFETKDKYMVFNEMFIERFTGKRSEMILSRLASFSISMRLEEKSLKSVSFEIVKKSSLFNSWK
jgi:hypothetical protein